MEPMRTPTREAGTRGAEPESAKTTDPAAVDSTPQPQEALHSAATLKPQAPYPKKYTKNA